jgi:hypothetical protein
MERITETVKVKGLDGKEIEVRLYKYVPFRQSQSLLSELTNGSKFNSTSQDMDIDGEKLMNFIVKLAEVYWADKNVSLDDVENESLMEVIEPKLKSFLGKLGAGLEMGNPKSS